MRIFHLLASHDTSARTGVPRFSGYFKDAFPHVINITLKDLPGIKWDRGDVVVADNHFSIRVPQRVQTIVVAHGCAPYHYEVDESWRNPGTERIAVEQRMMFYVSPNRIFVAPSAWVADVFKRYAPPTYDPLVLPHWVPVIEQREPRFGSRSTGCKPVVIGDWRNHNKGKDAIDAIREAAPEIEFRQLDFDGQEARENFYRTADAYLCLSLSEGAPYSVADAEAAGLPIVTTEVGNVREFENVWQIDDRNDIGAVRDALLGAIASRSSLAPSFFSKHTFEAWKAAWEVVVNEASKRSE